MSDLDQPTRADILSDAAKLTLGDRNTAYGDPYQNMQNIAGLWSAYIIVKYRGHLLDENTFALSAEDIAHLNTLQKIARHMTGPYRVDNYVDSAAYEAIAGECALIESQQ